MASPATRSSTPRCSRSTSAGADGSAMSIRHRLEPAASVGDEEGATRRGREEVDPAIVVSISGDKSMASGWQRVERDRLEPPAEAIAIERSGTIRVAHDQVGPTRVRDQTEGHGVEHLTGGEREVSPCGRRRRPPRAGAGAPAARRAGRGPGRSRGRSRATPLARTDPAGARSAPARSAPDGSGRGPARPRSRRRGREGHRCRSPRRQWTPRHEARRVPPPEPRWHRGGAAGRPRVTTRGGPDGARRRRPGRRGQRLPDPRRP